ncbi:MAG: vWA domain-containing protein, partial [Thermoguttaceae bacterium]
MNNFDAKNSETSGSEFQQSKANSADKADSVQTRFGKMNESFASTGVHATKAAFDPQTLTFKKAGQRTNRHHVADFISDAKDKDTNDKEKFDPEKSRFGIVPPSIGHRTFDEITASYAYDNLGISETEVEDDDITQPLIHAKASSSHHFIRNFFRLAFFLFLIISTIVVLVLPLYYSDFFGSVKLMFSKESQQGKKIIDEKNVKNDRNRTVINSSPAPRPSNDDISDVKFFGLTVSGTQFVYLIDCSNQMKGSVTPSPFTIVKQNLLESLNTLQDHSRYGLVFFNTKPFSPGNPQDVSPLMQADTVNILQSRKLIGQLTASGNSDLIKAIYSVFSLEPDAIFLVCANSNARSLSSSDIIDIIKRKGHASLNVIEFGYGQKPVIPSPLEFLANQVGGKYKWENLTLLQAVASGDTTSKSGAITGGLSKNKFAPTGKLNVSGDYDFDGTLSRDFEEPYIQDISTVQSRRYSPFGRKLPDEFVAALAKDTNLDTPPQIIPLPKDVAAEIEMDARIVYLSGFLDSATNPKMLRTGAESRLALWVKGAKAGLPA